MKRFKDFLREIFGGEKPVVCMTHKQYQEYFKKSERFKNMVKIQQREKLRQKQEEETKQRWATIEKLETGNVLYLNKL